MTHMQSPVRYRICYFWPNSSAPVRQQTEVRPSSLMAESDEAGRIYQAIKPYLAFKRLDDFVKYHDSPVGISDVRGLRRIVGNRSQLYEVRWMPKIEEGMGWRRLTYAAWCGWYGIPI